MLIYLVGAFIVCYALPKISIDFLQMRFVRQKMQTKAVILNQQDYQKAGEYSLATLKLSIFDTIFECVVMAGWFGFGFSYLHSRLLWLSDFWQSLCFFLVFFAIHMILALPARFYQTMILDKRFGFSKSSFSLFLLDSFKAFVLALVFGAILGALIIAFIAYSPLWWIWGFVLMLLFSILANFLYPTILAPLFNKFTPLDDESLKERINALLDSAGFKSNGIFVMDASKRDGRLNAYFGGFGKTKRVILFDTLLKNISTDGLLAVLGHELGHFKHCDVIKQLILSALIMFVIFFLAGMSVQWLLNQLGFQGSGGEILACILLLSQTVVFWIMPILGWLSRHAEYKADEFGSSLSSKAMLANALIRIVDENKSFPYAHPLYVMFYHSHPPLLDRLKALGYEA